MQNIAHSQNSQWSLAATICPSKRKIETILAECGIRKGDGAGLRDNNYVAAKQTVFSLYDLSGQEYDKAIKIITEYLRM